MFYHAKNGSVRIGNSKMDYISFGNGKKNLMIIPGLGDGLTTVKGKAVAFSIMYRIFAKEFTVYVFSRKNNLQKGYSTRDMANDHAKAMVALGISKADILGVSQGGMIAQYFAIDHPHLVNKLILAVTSARPNDTIKQTVGAWIEMAKRGNYKDLMIDTAEKTYSEKYLKKYRRFLIQAASCVNHNAYGELNKIVCPVLVIGADCDKILGVDSAFAIADKIQESELFIYHGLGHGAYEEAKDFKERVLDFLRS